MIRATTDLYHHQTAIIFSCAFSPSAHGLSLDGACASVVVKALAHGRTSDHRQFDWLSEWQYRSHYYHHSLFFWIERPHDAQHWRRDVAPRGPRQLREARTVRRAATRNEREGARQLMFRAACAPLDERASAVASPWGKVWRADTRVLPVGLLCRQWWHYMRLTAEA